MISAIIFDCFGVLTSDGWLPFKSKHFGHSPGLLDRATSLNKQSDAGLISYDDFVEGVAKLAGIPAQEARYDIENNVPNEPLMDYVQQLSANYKIGFLSNAAADWLTELFSKKHLALFDAFALSYETGFVKPDERAYTTIANRLDVPIEECVLIDDQERYCTGAREAGMQAIWFQDTAQTIADLNKLLGR